MLCLKAGLFIAQCSGTCSFSPCSIHNHNALVNSVEKKICSNSGMCFVVLSCSNSTSAKWFALQYNLFHCCPKKSWYFVYFRNPTWVDMDCTECALLHESCPRSGSLSGYSLRGAHQSWALLPLQKKAALEKPCDSIAASAAWWQNADLSLALNSVMLSVNNYSLFSVTLILDFKCSTSCA